MTGGLKSWRELFLRSHRRAAATTGLALGIGFLAAWTLAWAQAEEATGLGLPDMRFRRRGDELVQVLIETPKKLSKEQETLLRRFAETEDKSVLPESKGFFDKLMDYLSSLTD